LKKRKRASIMDWDMWLHRQIAAGEITEDFALKIRARVIKPQAPADRQSEDVDVSVPEWEPVVKPGHAADTEPWRISKIEAQTTQNGNMATDYKSVSPEKPQPNGEQQPVADVRRVQVLYAPYPRMDYTEHGLPYIADKNGQIVADEADVERLVN